MRNHLYLNLLIIIICIFYTNVFAYQQTMWNDEISCKNNNIYTCAVYDEDGVTIRNSGDTIPFNIGGYLVGTYAEQVSWSQVGGENWPYTLTMDPVPVYKDIAQYSMQIVDDWTDGTSSFLDGFVGVSIDLWSGGSIGNYLQGVYIENKNVYYDGKKEIDCGNNQYGGSPHCYRLYLRVKMRIGYIPQTMEDYNYRYLMIPEEFGNKFNMYNGSSTNKVYRFVNSQFYTLTDYLEEIDNVTSRNFAHNMYEVEQDYYNSLEDYSEKAESFYTYIQKEELDDSIGSNFFNNFTDSDHGGLSGVVTAPLKFVKEIKDDCEPYNIPIYDKTIQLQCGTTIFWDKPEVQSFRNVWNIIVAGPIIYGLVLYLLKVVNNLKDPDNSKVEVLDL